MGSQTEAFVENHLRSALAALGLGADCNVRSLLAAYQGEDRFYHNLDHIADCLAMAETLGIADPRIPLALCYHDAVYDSRAKDNEERSAAWARRDLETLGAPPALCDDIERLILATAHRSPPQADDERLLVDIDLSILGREEEAYDRYAAAVRKEYGWVSDTDYRKGRGQFLQNMLSRPKIFSAKEMRKRFERGARSNMERELGKFETSLG